jgi:hypothetical protein
METLGELEAEIQPQVETQAQVESQAHVESQAQVESQTKSQTQTRKRRVGMEQLRDAVKDLEETVVRLSDTNNRVLKNKLEGLNTLIGKHCSGSQPTVMSKVSTTNAKANAPVTQKKPMLSTIPEEGETPKMMSKARVIDQTFNKFRTELSDSLKTMGKPLTTDGNKVVSSVWKSAKDGNLNSVKNSLKSLGVPESELAPMSAKAMNEAKSYLARSQTKKVKATPMTPGKTRKVKLPSLTVPTTQV